MRRADVVQQYEEASGTTLTDVEYYEVFAALRFAIVSVRTSARAIAYGDMEPWPTPRISSCTARCSRRCSTAPTRPDPVPLPNIGHLRTLEVRR